LRKTMPSSDVVKDSAMKRLVLLTVLAFCPAVAGADEPGKRWAVGPASLRPFWRSETMVCESVLFLHDAPDARPSASLLFEPTRIVWVGSSSGEVTYEGGRDYLWKPGTRQIVLPPGSTIVSKTPQELRRPAGSQRHALTHRDGSGEIFFGATHEYHDMQTAVTYEHRPGEWAGPAPSFAGEQLPRTVKRLAQGEPLGIALLGDSISTGCNASGWAGVAPFQPPYQDLLALGLEAAYDVNVTLENFAVGGTDTAWGLANVGKVIRAKPDLVILAFGMNDAARHPAGQYQANVRAMIDTVRAARPEAEFILVATMLGNRDWTTLRHELFPPYRDALAGLCGPGIALADMTSIWEELLKHKNDCDMTGNGVNHPNDFGHRVYAQVLWALLIPEGQGLVRVEAEVVAFLPQALHDTHQDGGWATFDGVELRILAPPKWQGKRLVVYCTPGKETPLFHKSGAKCRFEIEEACLVGKSVDPGTGDALTHVPFDGALVGLEEVP